jgi:hypothetical protein
MLPSDKPSQSQRFLNLNLNWYGRVDKMHMKFSMSKTIVTVRGKHPCLHISEGKIMKNIVRNNKYIMKVEILNIFTFFRFQNV